MVCPLRVRSLGSTIMNSAVRGADAGRDDRDELSSPLQLSSQARERRVAEVQNYLGLDFASC
jgi:hypothetical protein